MMKKRMNDRLGVRLLLSLVFFLGSAIAFGQPPGNVDIDNSAPPVVIDSIDDIDDVNVNAGKLLVIRSGAAAGVHYYSAESSATVDSVDVLDGPDSVGRWLRISEGGSASKALYFDTVTTLLAQTGVKDGQEATTSRYSTSHTVGDGSGNTYVYDADSTATVDEVFVLPGVGGALGGSDGTGRWLGRPRNNVIEYGLIPDDPTKATFNSAILAAIRAHTKCVNWGSAANANQIYYLQDAVDFSDGELWRGDSSGRVRIQFSGYGAWGSCIRLASFSEISHLTVMGPGKGTAGSTISVNPASGYTSRWRLERVGGVLGGVGLDIRNGFMGAVVDCRFTGNGTGISIGTANTFTSVLRISGGDVESNDIGIDVQGGYDNTIEAMAIQSSSVVGLRAQGTTPSRGMRIQGCYFELNGTTQMTIANASAITITGNGFHNRSANPANSFTVDTSVNGTITSNVHTRFNGVAAPTQNFTLGAGVSGFKVIRGSDSESGLVGVAGENLEIVSDLGTGNTVW